MKNHPTKVSELGLYYKASQLRLSALQIILRVKNGSKSDGAIEV
jgi:hypothetical protein